MFDPSSRSLRSEALPDGRDYLDTGCPVSPRCLSCPLGDCLEESAAAKLGYRALQRAAAVARLDRLGFTRDAIARSLGMSRRTVYRLLAAPVRLDPHPIAQLAANEKSS